MAREIPILIFAGGMLFLNANARACEPTEVSSQLAHVKDLKAAGQHSQAIALADNVLRANPGNLHAAYAKGAAILAQSASNASAYRDGMAMLTSAADELTDFDKLLASEKNCPENPRLYTIFNMIGIYAFNAGDRKTAEKYLLRGLNNLGPLDSESKWKLYDNLGLFYAKSLNLSVASSYYTRARDAGSPSAASRLSAIQGLHALAAHRTNP